MLEVGAFAEREKDLADVVLQVIVNSNMEKVQKWKGSERIMCEALRVLMADELNEERMEGQREGRIEGQREGRIEGQREGRIEGQREGQIRAYAGWDHHRGNGCRKNGNVCRRFHKGNEAGRLCNPCGIKLIL